MKNLSRPTRQTFPPDRGDFIETDGGAIGIYIGTSAPGGVQNLYYPHTARLTFLRECDAFDLAQRARDRVEILRRAKIEAADAFGYGLRLGHNTLGPDRSPLMVRATALGTDYRSGRTKWTVHEPDPAGGFNCMCAPCRLERLVAEATP